MYRWNVTERMKLNTQMIATLLCHSEKLSNLFLKIDFDFSPSYSRVLHLDI